MKEGEGISQEHICKTHGHNNVIMATGERGLGAGGWGQEKRAGNGDICNSVNNKIFRNKKKMKECNARLHFFL